MNVDLDAIAQRGRCEVSSLRLALPLIEQGYTPPFLARYRRDELGGIDEAGLWSLFHAVEAQKDLQQYRDELYTAWQATELQDPAIGRAIKGSKSRRLLDRLSRRVKVEAGDSASLAQRVAVKLMNPSKGDAKEIRALAESVGNEHGGATSEEVDAALAKLDAALAKRLCGDPRIVGAAVRWLSKHAKIHVVDVNDPHGDHPTEKTGAVAASGESPAEEAANQPTSEQPTSETSAVAESAIAESATSADAEATPAQTTPSAQASPEQVQPEAPSSESPSADVATVVPAETTPPAPEAGETAEPVATADAGGEPAAAATDDSEDSIPATTTEPTGEATTEANQAVAAGTPPADATQSNPLAVKPSGNKPSSPKALPPAPEKKPAKKKKMSPRQRRRRWLVSTLKPLAGKKLIADKMSAFQVVMLGRALRSQVAQCAFHYDAAKLVAELQKSAANMNREHGEHLAKIVFENEAVIRDAAEGAWWDELQEKASTRLVTIAADHLHGQMNRGGVEAKVIMSIDAVGPRTAATSIVAADGRVIHNEDIPCQLSAAMRSLAVTKMGELIHNHHVDLIVISNGPARRACMIALGELLAQSGEQKIRWTLADRSGADAYAGSPAGDQEMKSTPRRFRSAAWIAFSVLQPSQALVKVDPLKLRLGSFQRELSEKAILRAVDNVLISGASRGGVDVNSTAVSWMQRLPGVTKKTAEEIDQRRRSKLIASRSDLATAVNWDSTVQLRQALPFLRVFKSDETLDGTLVHPDDYELAKKLAKALEIELPPDAPPGYELPDYSEPEPTAEPVAESPVADSPNAAASVAEDAAQPDGEQASTTETEDATAEDATENDPAETSSVEASSNVDESTEATLTAGAEAEEPDAAPESSESAEADQAEPTAETNDASPAGADSASPSEVEPESEPSDVSADGSAEETTETETQSAEVAAAPEVPATVRRPKPEAAKVQKLVKEWQVGEQRSRQVVDWLCEPFGEGSSIGASPAVMTDMPTLNELKAGDQVIGVVVGVMPFGVFVELSPECSGLIHVSRICDGYVEDLHEAVQIGDVLTTWVTGIDSKRRRVGLSAVSPEREAELQQRREQHRGRGGHDRGGPGRGQGRGGSGRGRAGAGGGQQGPGNQADGAGPRSRGGQRDGGGQARSGGGNRDRQGAQGQGERGGRSNRGGGDGGRRRGRDAGPKRGGRGPRKPEVYEVVGKEPEKAAISEAMQQGKEPLRSFGDLMQMFSAEKGKAAPVPEVAPATETQAPVEVTPTAEAQSSVESQSTVETTPVAETKPVVEETAPAVEATRQVVASDQPSTDQPNADPPSTPAADSEVVSSGEDNK